MVLRPIQMLLECASRNSEGQAHILRRDVPGKFVVAGLEGGQEGTRLLFRELREEEGRRQRAACPVPRGSSFREEPRVGKPFEERARVRSILKVKSCSGPGERVANVTCFVIVRSPGSASVAAPCASRAIGFGSIGSMVTPRALRTKEVEPAFAGPSRRPLARPKQSFNHGRM